VAALWRDDLTERGANGAIARFRAPNKTSMAALHSPGRTAVLPAAMRLALKVLSGALILAL
jgi:hypothetical protein